MLLAVMMNICSEEEEKLATSTGSHNICNQQQYVCALCGRMEPNQLSIYIHQENCMHAAANARACHLI